MRSLPKDQIAALLSWDSDFFGFQVARILPRQIDTEVLTSTLDRLRKDQVRLVYWSSDPADPISHTAASLCGGLLVDRKYFYARCLAPESPTQARTDGIEEYGQSSDLSEDLLKIALQCGAFSRFRVDPHFPAEAWAALYETWMRNSINRTIADAVLVKKEGDSIAGVITLSVRGSVGNIGLVGVDEKFRGQGIGRKLIHAALTWFAYRGVDRVEVVTQGDNIAACRLYESCGFALEKTDDFYHFWNPGA